MRQPPLAHRSPAGSLGLVPSPCGRCWDALLAGQHESGCPGPGVPHPHVESPCLERRMAWAPQTLSQTLFVKLMTLFSSLRKQPIPTELFVFPEFTDTSSSGMGRFIAAVLRTCPECKSARPLGPQTRGHPVSPGAGPLTRNPTDMSGGPWEGAAPSPSSQELVLGRVVTSESSLKFRRTGGQENLLVLSPTPHMLPLRSWHWCHCILSFLRQHPGGQPPRETAGPA